MTDAGSPDAQSPSLMTTVVQVIAVLAMLGGAILIGAALLGGSDDDSTSSAGDGRESLNISCFAYRDVNRNATYDLGDRPYAALRVDGTGSDATVTTTSNAGGFANFPMLLGGGGVLIDRPGSYRFEAFAPEGWAFTTGGATRTIDFVELAQSPAGIVAAEQCEPFGVVQTLTISGTAPPGAEVDVESDAGPVDVQIAEDGHFLANVSAGAWTVTVSADDMSHTRRIDVADTSVHLSRFSEHRETTPPRPDEAVVDFDGFTTANTITEIPNGYGGVDWANWVATHNILYGGPGYVNVATSGEFVAYNSSGHPAVISSDEPFDFVGGSFGVAWPAAEQHDIVLQVWRDETLVSTDRFRGTTSGPLYFAADYRGVTRVEISSSANWQFVVDDLELRTGR